MAIPVAAVVAGGAAAAGGIIGAIGAVLDSRSEIEALRRNAMLARMAADAAVRRGQILSSRARTQGGKLRADQQAAFAAGGVALGQGTPEQIKAETTALSEQDAQILRSNAAMEAFGFKEKAKQFQQDIKTSKRRALISGVQSILGGSAGVASAFL